MLIIRIMLLTMVLCSAGAQVPQTLSYHGRVASGTNLFHGAGKFKFALIGSPSGSPPPAASVTLWSNDGTSVAGSEPQSEVPVPVEQGLFSVLLGDTNLPNMTAIPLSVFKDSGIHLRLWFNDGRNGWHQLAPDQKLSSIGYAMTAGNVPDGAITANQLAPGSVTSAALAKEVTARMSVSNAAALDVQAFGAVGDGITDDTAAIQAALDAATNTTEYAEVFLPIGTYKVTSALRLGSAAVPSVYLRGAGIDRTQITFTSTTEDGLVYDGVSLMFWRLSDLTLYKTPDSISKTAAIKAHSAAGESTYAGGRMHFMRVKIYGFYYGVDFGHCTGALLENIEAYGNVKSFFCRKIDSAVFLNCFAGDGWQLTGFGALTNESAAFTFTNFPGNHGFTAEIIGGESRRSRNLIDIYSGNVKISGWHNEVPVENVIRVNSRAKSVTVDNCLLWAQGGSPISLINVAPGAGSRVSVRGTIFEGMTEGQYAIQLNGAADEIDYAGPLCSVTNTATGSTNLLGNTGRLSASNLTANASLTLGEVTITEWPAGGGGITLPQATEAAQAVVALSNAVVLAEIHAASNAVYGAAVAESESRFGTNAVPLAAMLPLVSTNDSRAVMLSGDLRARSIGSGGTFFTNAPNYGLNLVQTGAMVSLRFATNPASTTENAVWWWPAHGEPGGEVGLTSQGNISLNPSGSLINNSGDGGGIQLGTSDWLNDRMWVQYNDRPTTTDDWTGQSKILEFRGRYRRPNNTTAWYSPFGFRLEGVDTNNNRSLVLYSKTPFVMPGFKGRVDGTNGVESGGMVHSRFTTNGYVLEPGITFYGPLSTTGNVAAASLTLGGVTITEWSAGGGGITLLQATEAAQAVVALSNAVVLAEIYAASNAVYGAVVAESESRFGTNAVPLAAMLPLVSTNDSRAVMLSGDLRARSIGTTKAYFTNAQYGITLVQPNVGTGEESIVQLSFGTNNDSWGSKIWYWPNHGEPGGEVGLSSRGNISLNPSGSLINNSGDGGGIQLGTSDWLNDRMWVQYNDRPTTTDDWTGQSKILEFRGRYRRPNNTTAWYSPFGFRLEGVDTNNNRSLVLYSKTPRVMPGYNGRVDGTNGVESGGMVHSRFTTNGYVLEPGMIFYGGGVGLTNAQVFAKAVNLESAGASVSLKATGDENAPGLTVDFPLVNGTLRVAGAGLEVEQASTFQGTVYVEDLSVTRDAGIGGDLSVGSSVYANNLYGDGSGVTGVMATNINGPFGALTATELLSAEVTATNGFWLPTSGPAAWPAFPRVPGDAWIGNSNGVVYLLTSEPGSASWSATNRLAP